MNVQRWIPVVAVVAALSPTAFCVLANDQSNEHEDPEAAINEALGHLSDADRKLAEAQRYCATEPTNRLGNMGTPIKIEVSGKPVFVCCEHCKDAALADPKATLVQVDKLKKIATALGKLPADDRVLAEQQTFCAVQTKNRLGSMGAPIKVMVKETPVFLCCAGCKSKALANADGTLKAVTALRKPKEVESKKHEAK